MPDPLDVLRLPDLAVAPDPGFAARLRRQVETELAGPPAGAERGGPSMSDADSGGLQTLTPYIAVGDARAAIRWYTTVLGARSLGEPWVGDDGRVGHAEVAFGDSVLMLSDEHPEIDVLGPTSRGGTTVTLHLAVDDVDAVVDRAVESGARLERPPRDESYGRVAVLHDPWGYRWMLNATSRAPEEGAAPGRPAAEPPGAPVGYFTLAVRDDERAKAFFGAVLGWRFTPGTVPRGWNIEGTGPMGGLAGGQEQPGVTLCYRVEDLDAALERVRSAGGSADDEPSRTSYGRLASCVDDQGMRFDLWQP
jgi:uncharacterized glyoxalase superfamily protein PhnB